MGKVDCIDRKKSIAHSLDRSKGSNMCKGEKNLGRSNARRSHQSKNSKTPTQKPQKEKGNHLPEVKLLAWYFMYSSGSIFGLLELFSKPRRSSSILASINRFCGVSTGGSGSFSLLDSTDSTAFRDGIASRARCGSSYPSPSTFRHASLTASNCV